ncbi:MAG TPA: cytochrome c oxidase subunit 4 [Amnibacterium sp.]|jgi:Ca2+/Na+ antiporter|uniref:aa3-type cytochrome oxidase subunit IV n=1 Tax=Amnibacterium sp. TaxID=1872496 RepID=UPI002F95CD97
MRASINVFWILAGFFFLALATYTIWALIVYGEPEWVGTVGLGLVTIMAVFIAFYLSRSYRSQGGDLPEDRLDASVDDGDPEMGFFSPYSWWPLLLATAAALGFLGIAVGLWIGAIGLALFIVAITGWVYEYYRGYFAR